MTIGNLFYRLLGHRRELPLLQPAILSGLSYGGSILFAEMVKL